MSNDRGKRRSTSRGIARGRAIVAILVVLVLVIGSAVALGFLGTPAVTDVRNRFAGVDETTTTIETDVVVANPNPIGVRLGSVTVNYTVELNDVRLASGTKEGVNVTAGNSTLAFRTAMDNERIPAWWVAHIRDGERSDLAVHATVTSSTLGRTVPFDPVDREIETDLLSSFNSTESRPVNANQPLVSDPVLYVNETSAHWGTVSEARTPIEMAFVVYNPKPVPYVITAVGYDVTMNGVAVGSGESDRAYTIPPGSTRTVRTTTVIDNSELDEWWVTHLERNQVTDLRIDFYARVELPGGGEVRVPLDALTYTERMETDVFGTKDETSPGTGGSTTTDGDGEPTNANDPGGSSTEDAEGGTTTAESTPTGTETTDTETPTTPPPTTDTATETDDGILLG